ncbi:hypothetical protein BK397_24050, partial [Escherichia coli]|uniref:CHRD domain-containing protein n=2 Tax=Escherichia coli TaxID=562 RepID=UPI000926C012
PPNGSTAGGWAHVTLNPDDSVTYDVRVWGLSATMAHIHDGPAGVAGPILVPLTGGPTAWSGTSAPLTAPQVNKLRSQGLYVNVHTAAFPGGEIRGQLDARPIHFAAFLNAAQQVPASGSAATGTGTFDIDQSIPEVDYFLTWNGSGATEAHLHVGAPGVPGVLSFPLLGTPPIWSFFIFFLDVGSFNDFQNSALYADIHSSAFPAGEIRGQVIPTGIKYGDTALMPMDFEIGGAPASGSTITVSVSGGNPLGLGLILVSLGPGAAIVKGVPFMLDAGALVVTSAFVPLDATGAVSFPALLPALGSSVDAYLQAFSTTGGPVSSSNGVRLPLVDLPF